MSVSLHPNHITVINFSKTIDAIANSEDLPKKVHDEIASTGSMESRGFQELNGYEGRHCTWSAGGYWLGDKFYVTSFGSRLYQWDGTTLYVNPRVLENT